MSELLTQEQVMEQVYERMWHGDSEIFPIIFRRPFQGRYLCRWRMQKPPYVEVSEYTSVSKAKVVKYADHTWLLGYAQPIGGEKTARWKGDILATGWTYVPRRKVPEYAEKWIRNAPTILTAEDEQFRTRFEHYQGSIDDIAAECRREEGYDQRIVGRMKGLLKHILKTEKPPGVW